MICSRCHNADTRVSESRDSSDGSIRRRRVCEVCGYRFTTYERVERPQLVVVKNGGGHQLFDRNKLLAGLYRATEKTPVDSVELERLVADVEEALYALDEPTVKSSEIGDMVMQRLARLNEVAYVRFASVYKRFEDINGFERELLSIKQQREGHEEPNS